MTWALPPPPIARLAAADSLLLGCDFDGTLAPIEREPADARMPRSARESLTRLARLPGTTVAILSGRTLTELTPFAAIPSAWLVGYHGAEIRRPEAEAILRKYPATGDFAVPEHLSRRILEFARGTPGVRVELKPAGVALHWRDNGRSEAPLGIALLERALETMSGPRTHLVRGRCLLEITTLGADKGWALGAVRREIQPPPAVICYLGDDLTDEDAFRAIRPDGIGILVADDSSRSERPGPTAADFTLPGPSAVDAFLRELATLRTASREARVGEATQRGGE
jgi:trehalose 6-phosphate phosphatase